MKYVCSHYRPFSQGWIKWLSDSWSPAEGCTKCTPPNSNSPFKKIHWPHQCSNTIVGRWHINLYENMRHVWGYRVWTSPQISPFYFSIHSYDSYDSWCRLGAFLLRFSRESIWVITGPMFCWRFGSNVNVRGSLWSTLAHERQTPGQDGNRELNEAVDGPAKVGRVMLGLSLLALLKFLCFSTGMFGSTWLGQHGAAYKNIASLLHIQYVDMHTYIHTHYSSTILTYSYIQKSFK